MTAAPSPIAIAVGRRRNLVSHALFRDPYFPSITVCAISRGANDGRRDVVVSGPVQMGVTDCVDGDNSYSPLSVLSNRFQVPTSNAIHLQHLPPLSWSFSRYRARCDRRGPAIEVAGSPPPSSSLPPNMPLVPPPAVVKHSHSILDVVVDEVSLFSLPSNWADELAPPSRSLNFNHQCAQHWFWFSSVLLGKARQVSVLPSRSQMVP